MKRLASLSLFALAFAAAPAISQAPHVDAPVMRAPERAAPDSGRIARGLFVAIGAAMEQAKPSCTACHGLDGAGDSSGAFPNIGNQSSWYLYKTLRDFASGARRSEIMTPIAMELTDAEMQAVAAYYASLPAQEIAGPENADTRMLQIGGAISAVGAPDRGVPACAYCHGKEGKGGLMVYPVLAGQHAQYVARQLALWKAGERNGDPLDVMQTVARGLTDEQIRAVSLYFASIGPARGPARLLATPPAAPSDPMDAATKARDNASPGPPYLTQSGKPSQSGPSSTPPRRGD